MRTAHLGMQRVVSLAQQSLIGRRNDAAGGCNDTVACARSGRNVEKTRAPAHDTNHIPCDDRARVLVALSTPLTPDARVAGRNPERLRALGGLAA